MGPGWGKRKKMNEGENPKEEGKDGGNNLLKRRWKRTEKTGNWGMNGGG